MSLLRLSLRKKRFVPGGPTTGTGLAMSRGPTGSRWGPDARGPDGGIPNMVEPTYGTTAGASFTPFAIAGDFYDHSATMNIHPYYFGTGWDTWAQMDTPIARLQEMGIRHVRGLGLFSPAVTHPDFQLNAQRCVEKMRVANVNRSPTTGGPAGTGVQPMFLYIGTEQTRKYQVDRWEDWNQWELIEDDGGENYYRPLDGPSQGNIARTTTHWEGAFWGREALPAGTGFNAVANQTPLGWDIVCGLSGPNEPEQQADWYTIPGQPSIYWGLDYGVRWIARSLRRIRDANETLTQFRKDYPLMQGESYVDYDTGRIVAGPAKFNQMPIVCIEHHVSNPIGNGGDYTAIGDYTNRVDGDFYSHHQYWGGHPPNWKVNFGTKAEQQWPTYESAPNDTATFGQFQNIWPHNGKMNAAGGNKRFMRSIPVIMGENGYRDKEDNAAGDNEHACPPDIQAEYYLQVLIQNYLQGFKRTYLYRLHFEKEGRRYGFCDDNFKRLPAFYAIKNFLGILGFEDPGSDYQQIQVPHEFTPGSDNWRYEAEQLDEVRPDLCMKLVVQKKSVNGKRQYLIFLSRTRSLWNIKTQARYTAHVDPRNTILHLPSGNWDVEVAEPAKNPADGTYAWSGGSGTYDSGRSGAPGTPNDGQSYPNITNGQAWDPANSGNARAVTTGPNNTVTVPLAGLTRVVRITESGDPAEPPQLLTVTKGPYASGTSWATAIAGATSGDVIGLQAGTFNWGTQTPPAGVTFQGPASGAAVINGQFTFTNANAKLRNLTVRAVTADTQKSVLEIDANGVEVDWCEIDGTPITHTTAPKPSAVFIGGISVQVQNVKIRRSKIRGPTNGDSQSHAFYIANPDTGCLIQKCWIYDFPGYGLHFNTNGDSLLAERCVVDDSATRGAAVFSTESGGGPQSNTIDNCVLTAAGGGGVGAIHVIAGTNSATNNILMTPGVTTPGTGTLNQSGNTVVSTVTYQNVSTRDYRIPGNTSFQYIPGPVASAAPPIPGSLPIVVPASGSTPATLRTGSVNGPRLHLKGINIWGLPDDITNNVNVGADHFWKNQYDNRVAICNTIQGWGANCVRMRAQASDYNGAPSAATDSLTKTQILDRIEDWRDAIKAENMYLCICPWDGLDGPYAGGNFPAQYTNTFQFYSDVFARLGNDPMVFYETPNEPNNITMAQWQTVMQGFIDHFRVTMGYTGVLVLDPPNWANSGGTTNSNGNPAGYDDATYGAVQQYDAGRAGMGGKHQLVFAKHDYSNNGGYPNNTFNYSNWRNAIGAGRITHLIWENEFGNFNAAGPDPDTDDAWAAAMAAAARDEFSNQQIFVGAAPFLFGPWSDLNRITKNASDSGGPSNSDPKSPWGITVRDTYFGASTPPAVGFTPGIVLNGSTSFDANALTAADSLNPQVVRQEFDYTRNVASAGADRTFMDDIFTQYADNGIRILPLANGTFDGTNPTSTHSTNIATWAARYGPGGTFWTGVYGGTDRPITHIEYGNEVSYSGNAANGGDAAYKAKAQHYATSFVTTRNAVKAANASVGLLAIGDAAGNAFWSSWIDEMFSAVSGFSLQVDGWTVHPYGPGGPQKIQRMVDLLVGKAAGSSIPIDVTEIGVASCNNNHPLPDGTDYGDGRTLTYSQAATALQNETSAIRTDANWGSRIRHFMIYQAHDNQPVGSTGGAANSLEGYYGGLTSTLAEKGAFSTAVRTILAS